MPTEPLPSLVTENTGNPCMVSIVKPMIQFQNSVGSKVSLNTSYNESMPALPLISIWILWGKMKVQILNNNQHWASIQLTDSLKGNKLLDHHLRHAKMRCPLHQRSRLQAKLLDRLWPMWKGVGRCKLHSIKSRNLWFETNEICMSSVPKLFFNSIDGMFWSIRGEPPVIPCFCHVHFNPRITSAISGDSLY